METVTNLASLLALGFFLGMRHATDADHVIAIATIVARGRTFRGSAMIGAVWGIGHTLTILAVGGAIIVLGIVIPPRLGLALEFAVGVMLILLGVMTLTGMGDVLRGRAAAARPGDAARQDGHHHHAHGDFVHRHPGGESTHHHGKGDAETPVARLDLRFGGLGLYQWLRPLVIGVVHGLAGSAAVALLVLTAVRDPAWAMAYLLLFGAGTVAGMMAITVALAAPFVLTASLRNVNWQLRTASGLISFVFGLFLVYEIGFAAGGLFTSQPVWVPQ